MPLGASINASDAHDAEIRNMQLFVGMGYPQSFKPIFSLHHEHSAARPNRPCRDGSTQSERDMAKKVQNVKSLHKNPTKCNKSFLYTLAHCVREDRCWLPRAEHVVHLYALDHVARVPRAVPPAQQVHVPPEVRGDRAEKRLSYMRKVCKKGIDRPISFYTFYLSGSAHSALMSKCRWQCCRLKRLRKYLCNAMLCCF